MKNVKWYPIPGAETIPLREGRRVRHMDHDVAIFNVGDGYLAVDNRCPHKQGPLSDGILSGKSVFCPLHNWKISLESGCALSGGQGQVKSYPVKLVGGRVYIAFNEGSLKNIQETMVLVETPAIEMD